ncbi:MAG: hypothetical protein FJ335_05265 [Sphingomonadales bacterium]|nr:hypothetical protein [Sphingomonadales bacterium]
MTILLPQPRLPNRAVPRLIDFGTLLTPPGGGVTQRLNRLGNRYALDITYPRLKPEPDGRVLASRVRQAVTAGARYPFPQPGLDIGTPGAPAIDGGGQAGSVLALRGFAPGYVVREGQFFSIVHAGRRYLHAAGADAVATVTGAIAITIVPMLRISPSDGAVCEFAQPFIEGTIAAAAAEIEQTIAKSMLPTITITERA